MNNQRITAQTKSNVKAADRAELIAADDGQMVKIYKGERAAFVCGSNGPMIYPTATDARRAIKRMNPALELTTFMP